MKINKIVAASIATLLLMSVSFSASASASVKHNASCKKINQIVVQKDITYKCAKIKKELVWKAISKKTIVISSPTSITSSPNISLADSFFLWAQKNMVENKDHTAIKNDDVPLKDFSIINPTEKLASNIFGNLVGYKTYSIMSVDDLWFFEQGRSLNLLVPSNDNKTVCYTSDSIAGCTNLMGVIFYNLSKQELRNITQIRAIGAHEYFHLVQSKLGNLSPFVKRNIPLWFSEGSAEFVGYAVLAMESNKRYEEVVIGLGTSKDMGGNPYIAGRVAIEYLVKEYGFEKILNVFRDYSTNTNFDEIFQNNFSITVAELMSKL